MKNPCTGPCWKSSDSYSPGEESQSLSAMATAPQKMSDNTDEFSLEGVWQLLDLRSDMAINVL